MAQIDLTRNGWCDLIFEGRNKEYGAYKLRTQTGKRNLKAIITIAILAALAIILFYIKAGYDAYQAAHAKNENVTELSALNQPKKKEAKVERKVEVEEKKEVVKEVKSSIKFTAPVIKKDAEVKPEDEMKTQDQIMKTNTAIGALDVKGNSDQGEILKVTQRVETEPVKAEAPKPEVENKVFDVVEQMPSYPGGQGALMQFLQSNIKYPVVAQENGVQGRVTISFVVERDGSITDVAVARSVDPSLDREAMRVVKSMPKWIPGKQNGQAVRVKYNVPVSFRLQ
ncbi:cell envelope biogenesis protein TonB [Hallella multisaccharivorax DSM 17128]|uniref:Outer membrane transport energization protein TonB (TC 2.C.1.1.1) n=1 Tax=Hallella multisaccharivorax DSM 17128 TaxID=688246 RepID=F8N9H8_9BACT|nr:energy transducer TonB [Hallella multisaccharivorax]EGN55692.1 outer membrane transport energization protein TonB (TC 2.C.1.1.1) [Hallella multisaccharivorax DSM 17128]GJG29197.1 cell envelope biogenesis protein TonB [Hallella multisaccharivorax DSM 17128]